MTNTKRFFIMAFSLAGLIGQVIGQNFGILQDTEDCLLNEEVAREDIENGEAKLYMVGGINPIIVGGENDFEEKFAVYYHDFGCMPPVSMACLRKYNKVIFDYLDDEFDQSWRREIRDDVIGFKDHVMPFKSIFK